MALEIKHVADLMGKKFRIPSYQRGYRWERKQIEQLLNDLAEFSRRYETAELAGLEKTVGYYCLQPLVVTNKDGVYDIIDGQQRLTTIYLILWYLASRGSGTSLPYAPRTSMADGLYTMSFESRECQFFQEKLFVENGTETADNIDFYFLTKGYEVIKTWFTNNESYENSILELLLPRRYKPTGKDWNDGSLHDVRFIWYEVDEIVSIQTFENLNYGKISLTAAELVKALLFECDRYDGKDRKIEEGRAVARSLQWSAMEEKLQDGLLWGMLVPDHESMDAHIHLVLSFVASELDDKRHYSQYDGLNKSDPDWVFNIFCRAVEDKEVEDGKSLENLVERVDCLWSRIQKVYTVFLNWFNDRELYHRIGLYVFLSVRYQHMRNEAVLQTLYKDYTSKIKTEFTENLRKKIGELVRIKTCKNAGDDTAQNRIKRLGELDYNEDGDAIRKILLLFNVEKTLQAGYEGSRFPFRLVSEFDVKSIEHIHPQNLQDEGIGYEEFKIWFTDRCKLLEDGGYDGTDESLESAVACLKSDLSSKETFDMKRTECLRNLEMVDKAFNELADMPPEIMHRLQNLALVDGPTNSALGNKLLDAKRQVLVERSNAGKSYVPTGTWYAFDKRFSQPPIKDLKFWTKEDRESYFAEIEKVYNKFVD